MTELPSTERVNPTSERLDGAPLSIFLDAMLDDHRSFLTAVRAALPELTGLAEEITVVYAEGKRIVLVGAGTSGRLAALEAAECPPTFGTDPQRIVAVIAGGPAALLRSVEGAEDDAEAGAAAIAELRIGRGDLLIGVSASGAAPFVRGGLEEALRRGVSTTVLVGNRDAPLADLAGRAIVLDSGPEFVAGSTRLKAGSAQKIALNLAMTGAMFRLGRVRSGRMIAVQATNAKLRARAVRTIHELIHVTPATAEEMLDTAGGDLFAVLSDAMPLPPTVARTEPDVLYRALTADDVPETLALVAEPEIVAMTAPFASLGGEALFRHWLTRPGMMLGAFSDDRLVGLILVESRGTLLREHVADIGYIAVAPAFAGGGIGKQLVRRAVDWAASNGLTRVELRVWPDNVAAVRLYSRLGFEIEGRLRAHAIVEGRVHDALLMAWIDPRLDAARGKREDADT